MALRKNTKSYKGLVNINLFSFSHNVKERLSIVEKTTKDTVKLFVGQMHLWVAFVYINAEGVANFGQSQFFLDCL
jgi:hypothetical protein